MSSATSHRALDFGPELAAPQPETLAQLIARVDAEKANGDWVPACGGTEKPFKSRSGRILLYCWQPSTGRHAYLDCTSDIILDYAEATLALAM